MANSDHVWWLEGGRKAWNYRRKLVNFSPDLSGVNFSDVAERSQGFNLRRDFFSGFDFSGADLRSADMADLDFSKARFVSADLSGADLSRSFFFGAKFDRANLSGVIAVSAVFDRMHFERAGLDRALLSGAFFESDAQSESLNAEVNIENSAKIRFGVDIVEVDGLGVPSPSISLSKDIASEVSREQTYLVLYATNRKPIEKGEAIEFGAERGTSLNFGSCQVHVPKSHKVGSIGSPFWTRLLKGDDRLKIRRSVELNGDLHWQLVRENFLNSTGASPPTVLIHGYNTQFHDAVLWAAQIGYDLGLLRGVNLFSWPSQGKLASYTIDEAAVEASKYHLVQYLLDYMGHADGVGINVLAHSMGCRCLVSALEIIGARHPEKMANFNQIIFAAADVDQGVMKGSGINIIGNSGRTTSYVCNKDVALKISNWLHGYARVGFLPPVFILENIDTIEVGGADIINIGHGYVSTAREVLTDIFQLIRHSTHPGRRFSVQAASAVASSHWKLRD